MVEVSEEPCNLATLREYATVPIAYVVQSRYRVEPLQNGLGGWTLTEEPVANPYVKDYDLDDEPPTRWASRFNTSSWAIVTAVQGEHRIGGAVIAFNTPGVSMLEDRPNLAVLWDIRVHPDHRRKAVGSLLFQEVVAWAEARGCSHLKIETQNTNVPACKFYARMGSQLRGMHTDAYADFPDEVQLLWYRPL